MAFQKLYIKTATTLSAVTNIKGPRSEHWGRASNLLKNQAMLSSKAKLFYINCGIGSRLGDYKESVYFLWHFETRFLTSEADLIIVRYHLRMTVGA
jgi:hypothetical protein